MKSLKFFATLLVAFLLFAPATQAQDDEIREALRNELGLAVKELNEQCPMDMGSGITLQSVRIEDLAVVYACVVDENVVSMNQIEENRDDIQHGLEEYMTEASQDINVQQFVKCCKSEEKDGVYRYIGSASGKVADFFIEL